MDKKTLKSYAASLIALGPIRLISVFVLILGCSLFEGVSLLLIVPILRACGFKLPGVTQLDSYVAALVSIIRGIGLPVTLASLLVVWLFALTVRALLVRQRNLATVALQHFYEFNIRTRLFTAMVNANWPFLSRFRGSELVDSLTLEVSRLGEATYSIFSITASCLILSIYLWFALRISAKLTILIALIGLGLVLVLQKRTRALSESGAKLTKAFNELCSAAVEQVNGLKTTKAYGAEAANCALFAEAANRIASTYLEIARHIEASYISFELGSALILAGLLYVAVRFLSVPSEQMLVLVALFARMMPQASRIYHRFQSVLTLLPAFRAVSDLEERFVAADEHILVSQRANSLPEFRHVLTLDRVAFSYLPDRGPVLTDLTLSVYAGQITAIVGPSGAGKSTLADILMGLVIPQQGNIIVDGITLSREQVYAWRSVVGYVGQDTPLFHDTIRNNLLWACPQASESDVEDALRMAAASDFVTRLPNGLDTIVGDRGVLLSSGERQRIALARALLRKPRLLILDEAFNCLDSLTEEKIWQALSALRGKISMVVIAHRLATVQWADTVYVIENGRIVESGNWSDLYTNQAGRLRALLNAQKIAI